MKMIISESVLKMQFGLRDEFEIWHTYSLGVAQIEVGVWAAGLGEYGFLVTFNV